MTDFYWIESPWPGKLAIFARPRGGKRLDDEIRTWNNAGLSAIVSLLTEDEADELDLVDERQSCESLGLRFFRFPINDVSLPASSEATLDPVNELESLLSKGHAVGIHCREGVGRSGIIAACLLIKSGLVPEEAMETVSNARGVIVPQTDEQREWVIAFARQFAPAARGV